MDGTGLEKFSLTRPGYLLSQEVTFRGPGRDKGIK